MTESTHASTSGTMETCWTGPKTLTDELQKGPAAMASGPPAVSITPNYTARYTESILVTGGVGFVGSHIAEALLRMGKGVVAYDIFNSECSASAEKRENASILHRAADANAPGGASLAIVHGDIRDRERLMETIAAYGITGCIHVGGMVDDRRSVFHPEEYIDVNIRGTAILLDCLGKSGVKMVVQASTRSVFGQRDNNDTYLTEKADRRPVNPYGASKVGADAMAHCYSFLHEMNVTLVRIFATYGPRGRPDMIPRILVENICRGVPIRKFGTGTATRTWIYISDIVSAFICALHNPCNGFAEFNTGAPNSTTLNELIRCAEKVVGKKAIIEQCEVPPGDAHTVGHPSYDLITKTLGWSPKVGVEEGMRLTYLDYLRQLEEKAAEEIEEQDVSLAEGKKYVEEEKKEDGGDHIEGIEGHVEEGMTPTYLDYLHQLEESAAKEIEGGDASLMEEKKDVDEEKEEDGDNPNEGLKDQVEEQVMSKCLDYLHQLDERTAEEIDEEDESLAEENKDMEEEEKEDGDAKMRD